MDRVDGGEVRRKVPVAMATPKVRPRSKTSLKCRFMATAWCCTSELRSIHGTLGCGIRLHGRGLGLVWMDHSTHNGLPHTVLHSGSGRGWAGATTEGAAAEREPAEGQFGVFTGGEQRWGPVDDCRVGVEGVQGVGCGGGPPYPAPPSRP